MSTSLRILNLLVIGRQRNHAEPYRCPNNCRTPRGLNKHTSVHRTHTLTWKCCLGRAMRLKAFPSLIWNSQDHNNLCVDGTQQLVTTVYRWKPLIIHFALVHWQAKLRKEQANLEIWRGRRWTSNEYKFELNSQHQLKISGSKISKPCITF